MAGNGFQFQPEERDDTPDVDPVLKAEIAREYRALLDLMPPALPDEPFPEPRRVKLATGAREVFNIHKRKIKAMQNNLDDDSPLHEALSKLRAGALRIALIVHMLRTVDPAECNAVDPDVCDRDSMESGVAIADWFINEARRVYADFANQAALRKNPGDLAARLISVVNRLGPEATARNIARRVGVNVVKARELIEEKLIVPGLAEWVERKNGRGRSVHYVALRDRLRLAVAADVADGKETA